MNDVIRSTLAQLGSAWRQVLAVHLVYLGLSVILFAPLLGALGQLLIKLSGKPALADMDLLFFALSPAGMIAFVLFAAVTIVISAFELASLMAVGVANASGKPIDVTTALLFSFNRVKKIFLFAAWLVIKLAIIVAPFVVAGGVVVFVLITDYDINYYLAVKPPKFWVAAGIIGIIGVLMAVLLLRRLINWSLALPLVLFVGTAPTQSFAASTELTRHSGGIILRTLIVWLAAALLLGVVTTIAVQFLAELLVPLFIDSVTQLAILFGLLAALWAALSTLATALAAGGLALLLATLAHQLEPQFRVLDLQSGSQQKFNPAKKTRRRFALGLIVAAAVATFLGFALLDEIQATDDAQIIAHRGAAGAAPENTLASVRQAIADDTDWVEIDVQETADGEVIVIHDSDFMKLASVNLRVWEATMEQVAEIDIGSWYAPEFSAERAPKLADVLAEIKGRSKLIVELKYYGHDQQLEQRVIDLIEAADMQDDIMIMSLEYAGIQKIRALRPDWKIGLLSARAVGDLTRLDADFLAVNMALARPALVKAAHAAGQELYVWTVNDALAMSQMMSLGVDGIITDEPALGREVLKARVELSSVQRLLLHMAPLLGVEVPSLSIKSNDAESNDAEAGDANIELELGLQQQFQDRISSPDATLAEFTTDGCSGGLSVGWDYFAQQLGFVRERHGSKPPWENCCVEHDRSYHSGGGAGLTAAQSFSARDQADDELRACVVNTAAERGDALQADYGLSAKQTAVLYETIADSMHMAVRLGGMPCTGLSWRWGYGWSDCS
jgi:glycerophosphoryl diester phosphodiesterase